ncbi:MAG: magnesium transporter CorA family protein [Deltaproteobacteria bacterium]|jgi:magnesium transporter|nr:magnesium transporter CorA family protein [Deltaproteobacteria bacterium]
MLTRYSFTGQDPGFTVCQTNADTQWIDLQAPNIEELSEISLEYGLPAQFLSDPLDLRERPRLEQEDQVVLMIIRAPHCQINDSGQRTFSTVPLGVLVKGSLLVTVCSEPGLTHRIVSRWSRKPKPISILKMVMKLFIESSADFIGHLELMEDITDEAESSLSKSQQSEQIMTLLTIDKALINYTVALKSNRAIISKLLDDKVFPLTAEEDDLLDHALIENQQAIYMADIFGQILGSLGDAFGNIINNNLNKVMKFLAGVTIILMVPTFIVGAYGMNLELPLASRPKAFWLMMVMCLILSGTLWLFFRRKRWI